MDRACGVVVVVLLAACGGDDGGHGDPDGSGGAQPDGSSGGEPDGSMGGLPDGSGGAPDGSPGVDAASDGMPANPCPPPSGTGLTPGWLERSVSADPAQPGAAGVFAVAAADDCSFAIAGATRAAVVLGDGEPNQTALGDNVWFAARFAADGTLTWAAELGPRLIDDSTDASIHLMPDGSVAVARALRGQTEPESEISRVSADGVLVGDPIAVPGRVALPLADGGAYLARTTSVLERRDAAGQVVWSRSIGPSPVSIAALADGRVFHASEFFGGTVILNGGQPDEISLDHTRFGCYFALHRSDGALEWARLVTTEGAPIPFCGAAAAGDWLAGWLRFPSDDTTVYRLYDDENTETGTFVETTFVSGIVVRYDASGQRAWHRTISRAFEGDGYFIPRASFSIDPTAGTVTVGGWMEGTVSFETGAGGPGGGSTSMISEPFQAWFARYTAAGLLLGAVNLSSDEPGTSEIAAIATRPGGSAILGGSFSGTLVFGAFVEQDPGGPLFLAEIH